MECPRCHSKHLYKLNGKYYCRHCISFTQVYVDDYKLDPLVRHISSHVDYHLDFNLTSTQEIISNKLIEYYRHGRNTTVLAVCGSGKTEITYGLIKYALNHGDKVCFTTPRKALCIDLYDRLSYSFSNIHISLIYGGHMDDLDSPMIICTTHQLYRFEKTGFHLIILDEADAYPFYGNSQLESIFNNCARGHYVKLSATIDEKQVDSDELLIINRRYHGKDLPLPYKVILPSRVMFFYLSYFIKHHQRVLVFVPTIRDCEQLTSLLSIHHFRVEGVHSKKTMSTPCIHRLEEGKIDAIVCTTILERGITIRDVHVIVYQADHPVFNSRTLIQIAGRVGRKADAYSGDVCFLSKGQSKEMDRCIYTIKWLNQMNV